MIDFGDHSAVILGGAAATYLTRVGGHLALSRLKTIPPRLEAALNAVPAAVLTTLVAPEVVNSGPAEWIAILIALFASLRYSVLAMFAAGWLSVVALRALGL